MSIEMVQESVKYATQSNIEEITTMIKKLRTFADRCELELSQENSSEQKLFNLEHMLDHFTGTVTHNRERLCDYVKEYRARISMMRRMTNK